MPFLNANLKALVALAKINESELARRTGVAQPVINRLMTGRNVNPKMTTIKPLANHFMVTVSQIIGEQSLPADQSFYRKQHESRSWNRVPLIEWEDTMEWPTTLNSYQNAEQSVYISTDANVSKYAYALKLQSCVMEPLLLKGTMMIIDPEREPENRHFVIVRFNNDTAPHLRQLLINGTSKFLTSLNPDLDELGKTPLQEHDKILATVVQAKRYY